MLYRWHRKLSRNERPWFLRWRPLSIAAVIALFLVLNRLIPGVVPEKDVFTGMSAQESKFVVALVYVAVVLSRLIIPVVTALAWLWWCDRPPRTNFALLYGFLGWLIFNPLVASSWLPQMMLRIGHSDMAGFLGEVLSRGHILSSSLFWELGFTRLGLDLTYDVPGYLYYVYYLVQPAVITAALGVMVLLVYALVGYVRRTHALVQYARGNHADLLHQA
jgi:hypothetical protein